MATVHVSVYHCRKCGNKWKARDNKKLDDPVPACPNLACGEVQTPIGMDLTLNKAPAFGGNNIQNKAIDETAKIVMEDHGLTDLRSDVGPAESMAPKLPPAQQARADSFFGAPRGQRGSRFFGRPNMADHAAAAMRGTLADRGQPNPIETMHQQRVTPPVHIVAGDRRPR